MRSLLLALALASVPITAHAERVPGFTKGAPYEQVRQDLLSKGFETVNVAPAQFERCSIGRDECQRYPETRFCSGTGLAKCAFVLRKGLYAIQVNTIGEEKLLVQSIKHMTSEDVTEFFRE